MKACNLTVSRVQSANDDNICTRIFFAQIKDESRHCALTFEYTNSVYGKLTFIKMSN